MIIILVVCVCASVMALQDLDVPSDFYDGDTTKDAVIAEAVALAATDTAQADTNTTTTATGYTPRRVGDVLVGSAGSGTNAIWIAVGTTNNDWAQLTL